MAPSWEPARKNGKKSGGFSTARAQSGQLHTDLNRLLTYQPTNQPRPKLSHKPSGRKAGPVSWAWSSPRHPPEAKGHQNGLVEVYQERLQMTQIALHAQVSRAFPPSAPWDVTSPRVWASRPCTAAFRGRSKWAVLRRQSVLDERHFDKFPISTFIHKTLLFAQISFA